MFQTTTYLRILCSPVESFSSPSSGIIDFVVFITEVGLFDVGTVKPAFYVSLYAHAGLRSFHQFMLSPPPISLLSTWWESRSHTGSRALNTCWHCCVSAAASSCALKLMLSAFIIRRELTRVLTGVKGTLISCKYWKWIWVCSSLFYRSSVQ